MSYCIKCFMLLLKLQIYTIQHKLVPWRNSTYTWYCKIYTYTVVQKEVHSLQSYERWLLIFEENRPVKLLGCVYGGGWFQWPKLLPFIPKPSTYVTIVMWCREISLKLNMWHFQFSIGLESSLGEVHFDENLTWIGPVVPNVWQMKDSQHSRKQKIYISFSGCISQSMLSTSDWLR